MKVAFKLGVGTDPAEKFHVADDQDSARVLTKLENTADSGSGSSGFLLTGRGKTWYIVSDVGLNGGDNLGVMSDTAGYPPRLMLTPTAVGVGTDSPDSALHVAGTGHFTDPVTCDDTPSSAGHLTRKDYVDDGLATKASTSHTHTDTVYLPFPARAAEIRTSAFPQLVRINGTNFHVPGYAFDAGTEEAIFFDFLAARYGSGNLTVWIDWYADTATSGNVVFSAQIAALTPDADTQDVETDAFATANTVTDSHLGTTGQRLHRAVITVSNLDSLAANDDVRLRVARVAADGSDTMTGDVIITRVTVSYSTT